MIDINELRRLAKGQEWIGRWYDAGCETLMAERNGEHEEVAHPMPTGLVPYLIAVQPASILELLDRLEAAEEDRSNFIVEMGRLCAQCDALRAKIEAMEQQKPVAYLPLSSAHMLESSAIANGVVWNCRDKAASDMPLYALPGAHPATSETGAKP